MRRLSIWLNIIKDGRNVRQLLVTGRAFSLLSFSSMLFFVLLGVAGMVHQQSAQSPIHSMKGFAASVSSGLFGDMLEMEMPSFESSLESESLTGREISTFLMRTLTNINPNDPSSILAGELPGMNGNDAFLIRKGLGTDTEVGPQDHSPYNPLDGIVDEGTELPVEPIESESGSDGEVDGDGGGSVQKDPKDKPTKSKSKIVFIYHSHNRESWYPEVDEKNKDANSNTKNITLVGKRLAEKLEQEGVGAMHSNTDYPTAIKGYRWELSYKYSMKTVKEALASSDDLKFVFDIHRDSQKRKYTTIDIDGKSYAQVYFVIGHRNPNWKKNEAFATKIHDALEKKYPGISRGIWGKTAATGNAEYNQSLASESVLIEVGGVENTLKESYRTADALAEVISEIYYDAEKVSGKE
ncbi:stage II sporulation protein P [Paenibacillus sp. GSMTC-2017]|uniref:stage II sporulation protein P n=1 Tax=Paenibacillus sp. GSMTC-2017 TaxID=2794350 RepID=UPI0018D84E5C|nr:stage II sporulation protein P [Paenibacillus sp. GSMTC-2017]MBH5318159.1 stage II sporulation protein P [Paenibacillus sp. GSMTC-2017]